MEYASRGLLKRYAIPGIFYVGSGIFEFLNDWKPKQHFLAVKIDLRAVYLQIIFILQFIVDFEIEDALTTI